MEYFLSSVKVEQQSYKTCNALLHLSDRYSRTRLEAACSRVLSFTPRPSFKAVDSVLKSGKDQEQPVSPHTRGGDAAAEKGFLLPLPRYPFERAEWTTAKIQKDYHVRCGDRYYSVPYSYIGYKVDVRATRNVVEVFHDGARLCSHQRKYFGDKYVTDDNHMPDDHRKHGEWSGASFLYK